jgi:hypothetical protein
MQENFTYAVLVSGITALSATAWVRTHGGAGGELDGHDYVSRFNAPELDDDDDDTTTDDLQWLSIYGINGIAMRHCVEPGSRVSTDSLMFVFKDLSVATEFKLLFGND